MTGVKLYQSGFRKYSKKNSVIKLPRCYNDIWIAGLEWCIILYCEDTDLENEAAVYIEHVKQLVKHSTQINKGHIKSFKTKHCNWM
jgi:hypothetical protein